MTTWIQTYTGLKFTPTTPRVEDISIVDIAHALSNQCRFSGHCRDFYSVAQHSILVAAKCQDIHPENKSLIKWALLHDASEAYLVDLPKPLKDHAAFCSYNYFEGRLFKAIRERFGLTELTEYDTDLVKTVDMKMLATEMVHLMSEPPEPWPQASKDKAYNIQYLRCWTPLEAEVRFMEWCKRLDIY